MRQGRTSITALATAVLLMGAALTATESPVADAAQSGDIESVRELLRTGADVNAAQGDGMTALHWAAESGNAELAEMLLYAGANVGAVTRLGDYTPLHVASRAGRDAVVSVLLGAGADVDAGTSTGGVTSLHFGAASGNRAVVDALVRAGADVDIVETRRGQTALMFAASAGRTDVVRALMAAGADVSLTSFVVDIPRVAAEDRAAGNVRNEVLAAFRGDVPSGTSWQPSPAEVQAAVRAANNARVDAADAGPDQRRDEPLPDPDLHHVRAALLRGLRQGLQRHPQTPRGRRQGR